MQRYLTTKYTKSTKESQKILFVFNFRVFRAFRGKNMSLMAHVLNSVFCGEKIGFL